MVAANSDVIAPVNATTISAVSERLNIGLHLATRKTPAVTIVAACIRALTGVGPPLRQEATHAAASVLTFLWLHRKEEAQSMS